MPVPNARIADFLDELADGVELENANPFRVRAYRNAARVSARELGVRLALNADAHSTDGLAFMEFAGHQARPPGPTSAVSREIDREKKARASS